MCTRDAPSPPLIGRPCPKTRTKTETAEDHRDAHTNTSEGRTRADGRACEPGTRSRPLRLGAARVSLETRVYAGPVYPACNIGQWARAIADARAATTRTYVRGNARASESPLSLSLSLRAAPNSRPGSLHARNAFQPLRARRDALEKKKQTSRDVTTAECINGETNDGTRGKSGNYLRSFVSGKFTPRGVERRILGTAITDSSRSTAYSISVNLHRCYSVYRAVYRDTPLRFR